MVLPPVAVVTIGPALLTPVRSGPLLRWGRWRLRHCAAAVAVRAGRSSPAFGSMGLRSRLVLLPADDINAARPA